VFDDVGVLVELAVTTAAGDPPDTVMSAVTVAHGALLRMFWAEGTISFETTNPLPAEGSATAVE
jgi:hypothetical protein